VFDKQLTWAANAAGKRFGFKYGAEVLVSYLPMSHVTAQMIDIFCASFWGASVFFAQPDALKVFFKNSFIFRMFVVIGQINGFYSL
jgi:long-subunit acyl-CoA synthetase (AMP-forming)